MSVSIDRKTSISYKETGVHFIEGFPMENVGVVAVRDYLLNIATSVEVAEFEQLLAARMRELRMRATWSGGNSLGKRPSQASPDPL